MGGTTVSPLLVGPKTEESLLLPEYKAEDCASVENKMNTLQSETEFLRRAPGAGGHRFLFIASDYKPWPGGIATYIDNLARGLRSAGSVAKVLGVVRGEEKERIAFLEKYEEWVSPFQIAYDVRPRFFLGNKLVSSLEILRCLGRRSRRTVEMCPFFRNSRESIAKLEKVMREERPNMVVFGHLDLNLYPLALLLIERQFPYIILAHDVEIYRSKGRMNDLVRRGMMLCRAKWIAANSRHTKLLIKEWGIPDSRIKIIHPPISAEAIDASACIERNHWGEHQLKLVTVCRLVKAKGIDIVIRALTNLRERRIPYRYVIAGEGAERRNLEGLTGKLGLTDSIHFTGPISDAEKWRLLQESDLYVMPSKVNPQVQHEGFGISFIEAAAFGVPGVGSNAGGIPDAVIDGETGILVPQESPEKLAAALCFLYQNPERLREMSLAARERARSQFSPKAVAGLFESLV